MPSSNNLLLRRQISNGRFGSIAVNNGNTDEWTTVKGVKRKSSRGAGSFSERWSLKRKRFFLKLLAIKRYLVTKVQNQCRQDGKGLIWIIMAAWLFSLIMYVWQSLSRQRRVLPIPRNRPLMHPTGITPEYVERNYNSHFNKVHPIQIIKWDIINDTHIRAGMDDHGNGRRFIRKIWTSTSSQQERRYNVLRPLDMDIDMDMTHYDYHSRSHYKEEKEEKEKEEDKTNLPESIWDDEWYDEEFRRPFEPYKDMPQCKPMHSWQTIHHPNCNLVHEQPLDDEKWGKYLASGHFRQTFQIYDPGTDLHVAMKTLKNSVVFNANLMESHRVDAVIYERMTASPWIMDIYGYCGYSGLFEYASDGDMADYVLHRRENGKDPLSKLEKLGLAIQAASAIASLHSTDNVMGYSAMMHTDIFLNQFVWSDHRFKLNDFNRGHLLWWDEKEQENCPYVNSRGNAGNSRFRAPEELNGDWQTEKVDVFSLGYIIYSLITENIPFQEYDSKEVQQKMRDGHLPAIGLEILRSIDPIDKVLMDAMNMCFEYNWRKRPRASDVRDFLFQEMEKIKNYEMHNHQHSNY
mmetsp:Transcript_6090/g.11558  ORF Transcript_6090/g.11558 Transcript_6090/m.11558 type:complete len:575 (-) Transcript_6090:153-1877(-)|eukprot:CAMPEP_0176488000 /NCGR_PEP_ID=MMETSP0200_2-20121128/6458_1 /TAXON_ID=947934 /ORGANISM="Chaetoceros sp., Strain GSL56" /LENGTH=574 /DNA_ID=CAMNT_0017884919 /DNA_START=1930 /DNA_END=3654 /DNA_ORIENTATION=-